MPQPPEAAEALRLEARRLGSDPVDLAEMRRVREDMDSVGAPWPEKDLDDDDP